MHRRSFDLLLTSFARWVFSVVWIHSLLRRLLKLFRWAWPYCQYHQREEFANDSCKNMLRTWYQTHTNYLFNVTFGRKKKVLKMTTIYVNTPGKCHIREAPRSIAFPGHHITEKNAEQIMSKLKPHMTPPMHKQRRTVTEKPRSKPALLVQNLTLNSEAAPNNNYMFRPHSITKTYLYNFDPLNPTFI